jgi:hypothetical protein
LTKEPVEKRGPAPSDRRILPDLCGDPRCLFPLFSMRKARRPRLPLRNGETDDEKASASSGSSVRDRRCYRLYHLWLGFVLGMVASRPRSLRLHRLQTVRIVRRMRVGRMHHLRNGRRRRLAWSRRRNLQLSPRQIARWDGKLLQQSVGRSRHPERDRPAGVLWRLEATGLRDEERRHWQSQWHPSLKPRAFFIACRGCGCRSGDRIFRGWRRI